MELASQKQGLDKYLKVNEAAEFLGVSTWTLRNWDKTGKLKSLRHPINGYRIYRHEDLEAVLDAESLQGHEEDMLAPHTDWSDMGESEHFVQFYESHAVLVSSASGFIGESLKKGEGSIVIATKMHRDGIEKRLQEQGIDVAVAIESGQFVCLDAAETLAKFMDGALPDPKRFREVVGGVVARMASQYGAMRAFGEMVALLWDDGNKEAAIKLEELWNELGKTHTFALFCAYPLKAFADASQDKPFDSVCGCHSRVIPMEDYSHLKKKDDRFRAITKLQRKAAILEAEIEHRKEVEKSLLKRERELTDFFENAAEGIHTVGADGTILWANKAELKLLGYEPEEYIGRNIMEFHADEAVIEDILKRLKRGETLKEYEARLRSKHGVIKHVLINSNVHFEDGKFLYTRCFTKDITERRQGEKAQALLAAIVRSSEDAILTKTLDGRILSWNPAAEKLFGYTANEAIGQPILMLIPADRQHEEHMIIERLHRGERIEHYETVRQAKDGRLLDILLSISPLRDGEGNVIGASKIAHDITERKYLQKALDEAETRVRDHSFQQVEGLMRLNELAMKLTQLHDPQSMLEALLSTMTSLHQTDMGLLSLYYPETGALHVGATLGFSEAFKACLERVEPGVGACGTAFKEKRRVIVEDTETDPLFDSLREVSRRHNFRAIHSTPVITRSGECIGVLSVQFSEPRRPTELEIQFADICVRQAADFMERMKYEEALKEADRRKDEFLATLAHELRNPLAPIKNAIHVLGSPKAKEDIKSEARHMMERQVHQMQHLIDDLMDVSRVSQGKIELQKQQLTLNDVIQAAVETAKPIIAEKHHNLAITQPHDPIWLEGDMVRLSQLFANLLNNAAKYTNEGGNIALTVRKEGAEVAIFIKDNGIGIPSKMLTSIFDLFVQVDNALERAQGGLGIGLTLVKELVALHGGRITAYSEGEGKGSEFTVYLPMVYKEVSVAENHQAAEVVTLYRVLVVDDNEASAKTLGWTLELIGHEITLAHDMQTAMDAAKAFKPEVILLDIGIPGMNGYDICRLMRQNPDTKDAFIIAQTGWGQQEHRKRSQEAGFDYHLVKPIDMHTLKDLLASLNDNIRSK